DAGPPHRLPPVLRSECAAAGEQLAQGGAHGRVGVDDLAGREMEHAGGGGEHSGGAVRGEAGEQGRGGGVRGGGGRHPSTSRSAISASRMRARARLPSRRSSHRYRNTVLSNGVTTRRSS